MHSDLTNWLSVLCKITETKFNDRILSPNKRRDAKINLGKEEKGEHQAQSQILQRSFLHLKYPCLVSEEADKGLVWYLTYKHMCVFVSTPGHSRL